MTTTFQSVESIMICQGRFRKVNVSSSKGREVYSCFSNDAFPCESGPNHPIRYADRVRQRKAFSCQHRNIAASFEWAALTVTATLPHVIEFQLATSTKRSKPRMW